MSGPLDLGLVTTETGLRGLPALGTLALLISALSHTNPPASMAPSRGQGCAGRAATGGPRWRRLTLAPSLQSWGSLGFLDWPNAGPAMSDTQTRSQGCDHTPHLAAQEEQCAPALDLARTGSSESHSHPTGQRGSWEKPACPVSGLALSLHSLPFTPQAKAEGYTEPPSLPRPHVTSNSSLWLFLGNVCLMLPPDLGWVGLVRGHSLCPAGNLASLKAQIPGSRAAVPED